MCHCGALVKAIDVWLRKADGDLEEELEEAGYADAGGTVAEMGALEEAVAEALLEETAYFLEELGGSASLAAFLGERWASARAANPTPQKLAALFQREYAEITPPLAERYIVRVDAALKVGRVSNRTVAWMESWSRELAELMKLDSEAQIEEILTTALEEGLGVDEAARMIRESGIRDEYYRARRVAKTELLRAHSVAAWEAMMQNPSVREKVWRHSGSFRNQPRENHVAMDGARVAKGEAFTLAGADGGVYAPLYPRDSSLPAGESVNCRCFIQPVVDETVLRLDPEERRRLREEAIAEMDEEWEAERNREDRERAGI